MTRYRKLHIFPAKELRESVLAGLPSVAVCGDRRLRTKSDIDAIKDMSLPVCKKCADTVAEMTKSSDVRLRERKGWDAFERETRPNYSVTFSVSVNNRPWNPPLAS